MLLQISLSSSLFIYRWISTFVHILPPIRLTMDLLGLSHSSQISLRMGFLSLSLSIRHRFTNRWACLRATVALSYLSAKVPLVLIADYAPQPSSDYSRSYSHVQPGISNKPWFGGMVWGPDGLYRLRKSVTV